MIIQDTRDNKGLVAFNDIKAGEVFGCFHHTLNKWQWYIKTIYADAFPSSTVAVNLATGLGHDLTYFVNVTPREVFLIRKKAYLTLED